MSKSVLVINTPESCRECNFRKYNEFGRCYVCAAKNNYMIDRDADIDKKQSWCPLVLLPEKLEESKYGCHCMNQTCTQYEKGFNRCLDKISKGVN